jgi:hypothetical protein
MTWCGMESYINRPQPSRGVLAVYVLPLLGGLCLLPILAALIVLFGKAYWQPHDSLLRVEQVAPWVLLYMGVLGVTAGVRLRAARSIEYEMTDSALLLKRAGQIRVISLAHTTDAQAWPRLLSTGGYVNRNRSGVRLTLMWGGLDYVYISPSDPDRFIMAFRMRKWPGAAPNEPKAPWRHGPL